MIAFEPFKKIRGGFFGRDLSGLEREGLELVDFVQLNQVHGNKVEVLLEPAELETLRGASADALLTALPGTAIAVRTADCVPILLAHPSGVIGVVHAGWRGTKEKILPEALQVLKSQFRLELSELRLSLGPAICGACYEVETEVASAFQEWKDEVVLKKIHPTKFLLDLKQANLRQALAAGVPSVHITLRSECTRCQPQVYYSHRAAVAAGQNSTGRNYSWVLREP